MKTKVLYDLPEFNGTNGVSAQMLGESKSPPLTGNTRRCCDPWAQYQAALDYKARKDVLDLQKNEWAYNQKLEFQNYYQQIMLNFQNYQKLMGCEVYCDASGNLMYALTDPNKQRTIATRLLNVSNYHVRRLVCYYPKPIAVLEIRWGNDMGENRFFWRFNDKKSSASFLQKLKANGVLLLVSGRTEKQAADSLLAFSCLSAEEMEIPYAYGWGITSHGEWHFAWNDEMTMREMLEYA